jgi:hypothetical protein
VKSRKLQNANPFAYYGPYLDDEVTAMWGRVVAAFDQPPRTQVVWANLDDRAVTVLHVNEEQSQVGPRFELKLPE